MPLFLFKPTLYHLRDIKYYQHLKEVRKVMETVIYNVEDAVVLIFNSLLKIHCVVFFLN